MLAHAYWYASALPWALKWDGPRGTSFFRSAGVSRLEVRPREQQDQLRRRKREIGDEHLPPPIPCAKLGVQFWF